jgi:hypothetical protein
MPKYLKCYALCPKCGGELLYCDYDQQMIANIHENGLIINDSWQYDVCK